MSVVVGLATFLSGMFAGAALASALFQRWGLVAWYALWACIVAAEGLAFS